MGVTLSSDVLIDHIYTSNISSPADAGFIVTDVADHFGIFCAQKNKLTCTQKNNHRQIKYYSGANKTYLKLPRRSRY